MKQFYRSNKLKITATCAFLATSTIFATSGVADPLYVRHVRQQHVNYVSDVRPLRVGVAVDKYNPYSPLGYFDRCIPLYRWVNRRGYGQFNGLWTREC